MYGFSVFLNEAITDKTMAYVNQMHENGFKGIFTSIHIPEDDHSKYLGRLQKLGQLAKEKQLELVVDASGSALNHLNVGFGNLSSLIEMGITAIRIDYGISNQDVATISRQMGVALNASTISNRDIEELTHYGADFSKMEAWHNYYPRPETGLGKKDFCQQNDWLKKAGFKVMAFVAGDEKLRGPLYEGLPTLERHRYQHPLTSALELEKDCLVDKIYVGDPTIKEATIQQFSSYLLHDTISFHAVSLGDNEDIARTGGQHTNRMDAARDVIRSQEGRLRNANQTIAKGTIMKRSTGSITIDNDAYGRYRGEVQITKRNLPEDDRVNVVGRIAEDELFLLDYCGPGQRFEIVWEE
ncbi:DUF871 domain-containing protein [Jeotgalibaca arthritidis]|uniref:DUF871 domain-containing protein n=1 Tax=Jeotgalibaca arthritidis TaxID=1868794 RepID=UPI0035A04A7B